MSIYSCQYIKICLFLTSYSAVWIFSYLLLLQQWTTETIYILCRYKQCLKGHSLCGLLCGCPSSGEWWLGAELIDSSSCLTPASITAQQHCPGLLPTEDWAWQGCCVCPRTHRIPGQQWLTSPHWTDLCFLQTALWSEGRPPQCSSLFSFQRCQILVIVWRVSLLFPGPFPLFLTDVFSNRSLAHPLWFWYLLLRGPKLTCSLNTAVSISLGKTRGYKSWGPWGMYVCVYLSMYLFNFLLV